MRIGQKIFLLFLSLTIVFSIFLMFGFTSEVTAISCSRSNCPSGTTFASCYGCNFSGYRSLGSYTSESCSSGSCSCCARGSAPPPCTPSCPSSSTYCLGSEPSNGCGGTCSTGTKNCSSSCTIAYCDSVCGTREPTISVARPCSDGSNVADLIFGQITASCSTTGSGCYNIAPVCATCDNGDIVCEPSKWIRTIGDGQCLCSTKAYGTCSGGGGYTIPAPTVACGTVECSARIPGYSSHTRQSSSCTTPFTGWTINSSFSDSLSNCTGNTCYCGAKTCTGCPSSSTYCPGSEPTDSCGDKCSTGTKDCTTLPSVGHIRIQGPSGMIKLNLISASDVPENMGVVKVARTAGDKNTAADLVATNDPDASPIRIMTPYGIRSWRKLP